MARHFAQLEVAIWRDPDFKARSSAAQRMFMVLFSQAPLSPAGVLTLAIKKWSGFAPDTTQDDIRVALAELEQHRFVVVDEDTEELLVRSFIRRDGGWKNHLKMWPGIRAAALQVESPVLRRSIARELQRLPADRRPGDVPSVIRELCVSDGIGDGIGDAIGDRPTDPAVSVDNPDSRRSIGDDIGDQVSDADGDGIASGVGEYLRRKETPAPTPGTTPPPSRPEPQALPADLGEQAGAEGQPRDLMGSLIAQVQDVRPEWGSTAIRTTLERARADGRPWHLTRDAMIRVANAPDSRAPARLLEQGPWWNEAANGSGVKPPRPADLKKCPTHPGELASNCRCCAADRKAS
jgi:hypothetical protein